MAAAWRWDQKNPARGHYRHFAQLPSIHTTYLYGKTCGRIIRDGRAGSLMRCGQDRDGDRHLYYPCRVDPDCKHRMYSIDAVLRHEENRHSA